MRKKRIAPRTEVEPAGTRFWTSRTGMLHLSPEGFLAEPSHFPSPGEQLKTLPDVRDQPAVVLLGEPGIGKSTALEVEHIRLSSVTDINTRSLHFNLREYSTDSLLIDDVFKNADIERWKIDSTKLYLHLDSLDEALLRIDTVANLLGRRFKSIPKDRLFVRIACRTALWPELTLEPAMQAIWGDEAVTVLELAPLRRFDAEAIARSAGIDVEGFLAEVTRAELAAFAHKPLTLHFLIALFKKNGRLPSSTSDLYRLGCRQLCDEKSPSRRDASRLDGRYLGRLGVEQRLTVASRIAAVTMLANRYAIWTGAETDATPESDVTLAALSGGTELAGSTDFEVSETAVREVLDTGLFSARGNSRMGWAHQSYAEFLAAEYLVGKKALSGKIVRLLTHPNGGLTPQLANVAAWAASLDSNVRKELIAREPLAMLAGDLSLWNDADLSELTKAVIRNYSEQKVFGFRIGLHNALARLKHDGLPALLRVAISDMSLSGPARATACAIAGACSASELEGDLMGLALNAKEEPQLRVAALSALGKIGEPGNWGALKALADGDAGPDPQQELKGKALTLLWPKLMSAEDVFARLVLPNPGYVGSYLMFVTEAGAVAGVVEIGKRRNLQFVKANQNRR